MNKQSKYEIISFTASILIIILFGYTAISKVMDYRLFVAQIRSVPIEMLRNYAHIIGWLIPITELALVLLLIFERTRKLGLILSAALLLIFNIYISALLISDYKLPCTCGGVISKMSWKTHLIFNSVLAAIAITPVFYHKKQLNKNIHRE